MVDAVATASLDFARLRQRLVAGETGAGAVIEEVLARIAAAGDDKVWITRVPDQDLSARAADLDRRAAAEPGLIARLPLFGVPFAVKDNIDIAGMTTTAACPDFAYRADATAPSVALLIEAGAILVGKTNLDQFATGLVGCRSPYGVPRNPFDARYIPGGSSSGSAVAVAAGLVSFALGTDTAGSGRVPAAFNNIVGLKPTRGRISTRGVVPACRSLDCVSIFALSCADAAAIAAICGTYDAADPFARAVPMSPPFGANFRFAVPHEPELDFFGDADAPDLFAAAVATLEALGGTRVEIDFAPFREAAALLYEGPWVAERLAAIKAFFGAKPEALLPITREIIGGGTRFSAVDAFMAEYRLTALRRRAEGAWRAADLMLLPTAGTIFTRDAVEAEPLRLNTQLGTYTNFVNLLDLGAIALPAGFRRDGMPFGVSLLAPSGADNALAALGDAFQRRLDLPLGATAQRLAPPALAATATPIPERVELAVLGSHLSGMPLNGELRGRGATLSRCARTAPLYRMFFLDGDPPRPGLVRGASGAAIEIEIWSLSIAAFGAFVAAVPPPLTIGTLVLDDGRVVKGFLCEAEATRNVEDITSYGGWRDFIARRGA